MSDKNNKPNPWSNGDQGPPDLDALFKKLTQSFKGMFSNGGGDEKNLKKLPSSKGVLGILSVVLVVWLLSGIYIVDEGNRGIILRFGAYHETTLPGPHWHIPFPVEAVELVDVDRVRSVQNKARMLTQDENIVEVELAVQYRVKDAADYLFNVRRPDMPISGNPAEGTIFQVMESALREVVGQSGMDFTLGAGRAEIAAQTRNLMESTLNDYKSGLDIISVNLQQSQPPRAVQDAFADAIKAREDEIRFVNEAQAYANGILPQARGEAARMNEEAIAYREKAIANADGEAERFLKLLGEYKKAPAVTRDRLYLQAVESVLSNSSKVLIDIENGNNIFYLPFDKLLGMSNKEMRRTQGALDYTTNKQGSDRVRNSNGQASGDSGRGSGSPANDSPRRRLRTLGGR